MLARFLKSKKFSTNTTQLPQCVPATLIVSQGLHNIHNRRISKATTTGGIKLSDDLIELRYQVKKIYQDYNVKKIYQDYLSLEDNGEKKSLLKDIIKKKSTKM